MGSGRSVGVVLAVSALSGCISAPDWTTFFSGGPAQQPFPAAPVPPAAGYRRGAGAVALSADDSLLYVVDTDTDRLFVRQASTLLPVASVPVGRRPTHVVVHANGDAWVANNGGRSLTFVERNTWSTSVLAVGVEPGAMALSPTGDVLYVVNAARVGDPSQGSLMAIDTRTHAVSWEVAVGPEPRGLVIGRPDLALVSLWKTGELVAVQLGATPTVSAPISSYALANASASTTVPSFRPRAVSSLVIDPAGSTVFAPTSWSTEAVLTTTPGADGRILGGADAGDADAGACPYYYASCGPPTPNPELTRGAVVKPGLMSFSADGNPGTGDLAYQSSTLMFPSGGAYQGASLALYSPDGQELYVLHRETQNVLGVFSGAVGVALGAGATGMAITGAGDRLFVYAAFDHTLQARTLTFGNIDPGVSAKLIDEPLPADVAAGRKLFFSASDPRLTAPAVGISCASCHTEGRDNGHTWNFAWGPRQTPTLAGRKTTGTAPYHWGGEYADLQAFLNETVQHRMGGTGLGPEEVRQLSAFLDWMPAADNGSTPDALSSAQLHGAQLFSSAGCAGCHAGALYTTNGFASVGTLVTTGALIDDVAALPRGLNVPSLLGVGRSGPYLHDGSAATLRDRLVLGKQTNAHGQTAALTDPEVDDLVQYLQTL